MTTKTLSFLILEFQATWQNDEMILGREAIFLLLLIIKRVSYKKVWQNGKLEFSGLNSQVCHSLVWPQASHLVSQASHFLNNKRGEGETQTRSFQIPFQVLTSLFHELNLFYTNASYDSRTRFLLELSFANKFNSTERQNVDVSNWIFFIYNFYTSNKIVH